MTQAHVIIISPATANANNGNWHTASRCAGFLQPHVRVSVLQEWKGEPCDALIALHARRSAASVAAFADRCPNKPLILVLTGTDVYRDIHCDPQARHSLQLAHKVVLLQPEAMQELLRIDAGLQAKTRVIFQSASPFPAAPVRDAGAHFDVIMAGHLRAEKAPETFMQAAAHIRDPRIRLFQVGAALEEDLAAMARTCARRHPHYQWLGALPHAQTRERIRHSQLLVLPSRMEGGANVIIEAVTSGVPVLASDISGNRGMLGAAYEGYFPLGDSQCLAQLIAQCADDAGFYATLRKQCAQRAALFEPERERQALLALLADTGLPLSPPTNPI